MHTRTHESPFTLAALGVFTSEFQLLTGDTSSSSVFPQADVDDLANGATRIPSQVTQARQAGKTVEFVKNGAQGEHWKMPDGSIVRAWSTR